MEVQKSRGKGEQGKGWGNPRIHPWFGALKNSAKIYELRKEA